MEGRPLLPELRCRYRQRHAQTHIFDNQPPANCTALGLDPERRAMARSTSRSASFSVAAARASWPATGTTTAHRPRTSDGVYIRPPCVGLFGLDPTVSRTIDRLAADATAALAAIDAARAAARARAWGLAGEPRPRPRRPMPAAAGHRHRRHPGHRPLGEKRRGGDVQARLRASIRCGRSSTTAPTAPGNRCRRCCGRATPGSNTAADHITVIRGCACASCPVYRAGRRPGRKVLIRVDGPAPPMSSWTGCTRGGCRTRSGSA